MNTSMIRYILGHVLKIEAILLLLPCLTAVYYQEIQGVYYLLTAAICIVLGFLMTLRKPKNNVFYLKEGCVGYFSVSSAVCHLCSAERSHRSPMRCLRRFPASQRPVPAS